MFPSHDQSGTAEENAKKQAKLAALQFAMQVDATDVQLGRPPELNTSNIKKQILREGGWTDIDILFNEEEAQSATSQGALPGVLSSEPVNLG